MAVQFLLEDEKIVSPINTFMLNTLTLKESALFFSFRGKETDGKALRTSAWETKGLFTWRWGTPGRWGNPPFRIISHFNLITTFT